MNKIIGDESWIGGVHADAGVGRAGTARDEADARAAGELAVCFGHEGRAAFLPADDQPHLLAHVIQRIEHRQVALARDAEGELHAVDSAEQSTRIWPPVASGML